MYTYVYYYPLQSVAIASHVEELHPACDLGILLQSDAMIGPLRMFKHFKESKKLYIPRSRRPAGTFGIHQGGYGTNSDNLHLLSDYCGWKNLVSGSLRRSLRSC